MAMMRWNGWGDPAHDQPLRDPARSYLAERLGPGIAARDASLESVLVSLPPSRLQNSTGFDTRPESRLTHSHGQSFRDWLKLRYGRVDVVCDAVAEPTSHEEAAACLAQAKLLGAVVIPVGGATSLAGQINPPGDGRRSIALSTLKLDRLLGVDPVSMSARFGAGVTGPAIERQLAPHGLVLGHYPQSFDYSTLGGWVATRSSGQQSLRYGRIEDLFAAGRLATPRGELTVGGVPASAAGPDLREWVLGSEGRLGLLTEVDVRLRKAPEREDFHAVFFPTWEQGLEAVRQLVQCDIPLSMLRLSNEAETATQLVLLEQDKIVEWLKRYVRLRGSGTRPVLLMLGITGLNREVLRTRREALTVCKLSRGVHAGRLIGQGWARTRFQAPYLREALWRAGYAADAFETCLNWPQLTPAMRAVEKVAGEALSLEGERVLVFSHVSHVYRQGCNLYTTAVFRSSGSMDLDLTRWQRLKTGISETIVGHRGTISHQHGVGREHAPYLPVEKGALGMDLLRAATRELDPSQMMNPGALFGP